MVNGILYKFLIAIKIGVLCSVKPFFHYKKTQVVAKVVASSSTQVVAKKSIFTTIMMDALKVNRLQGTHHYSTAYYPTHL